MLSKTSKIKFPFWQIKFQKFVPLLLFSIYMYCTNVYHNSMRQTPTIYYTTQTTFRALSESQSWGRFCIDIVRLKWHLRRRLTDITTHYLKHIITCISRLRQQPFATKLIPVSGPLSGPKTMDVYCANQMKSPLEIHLHHKPNTLLHVWDLYFHSQAS